MKNLQWEIMSGKLRMQIFTEIESVDAYQNTLKNKKKWITRCHQTEKILTPDRFKSVFNCFSSKVKTGHEASSSHEIVISTFI